MLIPFLPRALRVVPVTLFAGVLAFCSSAASASAALAEGVVKIGGLRGTVTAIDPATRAVVRLANGDSLAAGITVQTAPGSQVVLLFSNGSSVTLGPGTQLALDEYLADPLADGPADPAGPATQAKTKLNLAYGRITASVRSLDVAAGGSFVVDTPVGAAGVRGTTFILSYNPVTHELSVAMESGSLEFDATDGSSHEVNAGQTLHLVAELNSQGQVVSLRVETGSASEELLDAIRATLEAAAEELHGADFSSGGSSGDGTRTPPPLVFPLQNNTNPPASPSA